METDHSTAKDILVSEPELETVSWKKCLCAFGPTFCFGSVAP